MNNAVYGMTSGQMAPTSLLGMKTTTSPYGRDVHEYGEPIRVSELISHLPGSFYVTRQAVNSATAVRKAKKAILNAFKYQKLKRECLLKLSETVHLTENDLWKPANLLMMKWLRLSRLVT
jgi:2-oxoglutarate ferredoxin oxidoreductase subunit beta